MIRILSGVILALLLLLASVGFAYSNLQKKSIETLQELAAATQANADLGRQITEQEARLTKQCEVLLDAQQQKGVLSSAEKSILWRLEAALSDDRQAPHATPQGGDTTGTGGAKNETRIARLGDSLGADVSRMLDEAYCAATGSACTENPR